ncbi:ubiquitin-protein ligase E3 involved in vesicle docking Pep5/Vps11-like [Schizosaccharomyces pombe]|uniref:Pep5-like zinc finger protein C16A10.03c n=1 Tax=Schizosaccharomyces pombe (strain 972 / ATCC 24843) TaxID=284812 RepID=PEP5L_SCHPO|nr:putative Pep5/Vps11-like zinc finger domain-containing protein [Schizosaccharomyces pombe]P87295.2 RecName: Full=Pep5-like zinc finger protein C16A10.03c [Schizosaccharomyces pombe 972h-]CAB09996.4 zinc finger protein Pep5/Vps11-like (predicted) [Schizosaccharomyces pombe]|eukprot:NP_594043.2 putative Pep5/Vps11-like zinc finger domain-containing protein [Schizosaccharomyces pombe]
MNINEWEKFSLFQWQECPSIKILHDSVGNKISCIGKSTKRIAIGTLDGRIVILNSRLQLIRDFYACEQGIVQQIYITADQSALCCVVLDKQNFVYLQFWSLNPSKKTNSNSPLCLYEHRLYGIPNPPFPATSLYVSIDIKTVVCGFANGLVIRVEGDFVRDLGSRQDIILREKDSITNLILYSPKKLFVSTTTQVMVYKIKNNTKKVISNHGIPLFCSIQYQGKYIMCAGGSFLSVYTTPDMQLQNTYCVDGTFELLFSSFGLVFVVYTRKNGENGLENNSSIREIKALDVEKRYVLYESLLEQSYDNIFFNSFDCIFFSSTKVPCQLIRLPSDFVLCKMKGKKEHKDAFKIANYLGSPEDTIRECALAAAGECRQQLNFQDATYYYIEAIPFSDSAEIIKFYLEKKLIKELTSYLEALSAKGFAFSHEISTLIYLYIKLRKLDKLTEYVSGCPTEISLPILRKYKCLDQMELLGTIRKLPNVCMEVYQEKGDVEKAFNHLQVCNLPELLRTSNSFGIWLFNSDPMRFMKEAIRNIEILNSQGKDKELSNILKIVYLGIFSQNVQIQLIFLDELLKSKKSENVLKFIYTRKLYALMQKELQHSNPQNELDALQIIHDSQGLLDYESSILCLQAVSWKQVTDLLYSHLSLKEGQDDSLIQQIISDPETVKTLSETYSSEDALHVLKFFVRERSITNKYEDILYKILEACFMQFRIPIQHVLNILVKDGTLNFCFLKPLLLKWMNDYETRIHQNDDEIQVIKNDIEKKRQLLGTIQDSEKVCDNCEGLLDVPFVSYSCLHLVHRDCATETVCPKCKAGYLDKKNSHDQKKTSTFSELFHDFESIDSVML